MQTIHSRTYTNVALTVVIILMLLALARPYVTLPTAQAEPAFSRKDDSDLRQRNALLEPNAEIAAAIREVAGSNKEIAAAIRESSKSQKEIAQALVKLGAGMGGKE